jgi:hypothetical protein
MSDERSVEVYELRDGYDRYESMKEVLTRLPGDTWLPAKDDVLLLQSDVAESELNHQGRAVAYRVVEREFFYREERNAEPTTPRHCRMPAIWLFVRRIPEDDYKNAA